MDSFAISDLQRFSGVKAHTIRVWEQRYNALRPERSEGNTRHYSGDQLRRLLNLVSLTHAGYRISEISKMPDAKLYNLVTGLWTENREQLPFEEYFISQLIRGAMEFDEGLIEKMFSASLLKLGLKDTYTRVLYPVLERVGLMWSADSIPPAQEHFLSALIRQKLFAGIDACAPAADHSDKWLLFLPEDEYHDIGLLFSNYLIRQAGKKTIYLGASTSYASVKVAMKAVKPAHILLFMTHHDDPADARRYLDRLTSEFPGADVNIAGNEKLIGSLQTGKRVHWIKTAADLEQKLR